MSEKLMTFLDTAALEGSRGVPYIYNDEESGLDGNFGASESGIIGDHIRFVDTGRGRASFWRQYLVLLKRDYDMAVRDPALYFLQVMLVLLFGFLVGAVFLRMKFRVDKSTQNVAGALLWMVFINAYMQIFKVTCHVNTEFFFLNVEYVSSHRSRNQHLLASISVHSFWPLFYVSNSLFASPLLSIRCIT
jgi:hypothetical protein